MGVMVVNQTSTSATPHNPQKRGTKGNKIRHERADFFSIAVDEAYLHIVTNFTVGTLHGNY